MHDPFSTFSKRSCVRMMSITKILNLNVIVKLAQAIEIVFVHQRKNKGTLHKNFVEEIFQSSCKESLRKILHLSVPIEVELHQSVVGYTQHHLHGGGEEAETVEYQAHLYSLIVPEVEQ